MKFSRIEIHSILPRIESKEYKENSKNFCFRILFININVFILRKSFTYLNLYIIN